MRCDGAVIYEPLLVSLTDDLTDELTYSCGAVIFEMEVGMFRR